MYRIDKHEKGWIVQHFVAGDPNPTPTSRTFVGLPEATTNALGSAAKMSLMTGRAQQVVFDGSLYPEGNTYKVVCVRELP